MGFFADDYDVVNKKVTSPKDSMENHEQKTEKISIGMFFKLSLIIPY